MAQRAYGRIRPLSGEDDNTQKEYRSFAMSFPALIHTCGLAQAVAFAYSKSKERKDYIKDYILDLAEVLDEEKDVDRFLKVIQEAPLQEYLRLSNNALNAAGWLKRYSAAMLKP
jgi:CRISPR-associated protein Cmr5